MNLTRKQLMLLFGAAVVLLLGFVVVLAFQQTGQAPSTKISAEVTPAQADDGQVGSSGNQNSGTAVAPNSLSATPLPQNLSAVDTARAFYASFANGNPLSHGAFKTNQYLTDNFKNIISLSYKDGNTPVFCPVDFKPQVTIGKEQQQYYDNGYLTEETISDASTGHDLYIVELRNVDNQWRIFDITCL